MNNGPINSLSEFRGQFDRIQERVKFILEKNSNSRDDDTLLCHLYWMKFDNFTEDKSQRIFDAYKTVSRIMSFERLNLTSISSIVGARQRIQKQFPELKASPEAQQRRIGKFEHFRSMEEVENV